MVAMQQTQSSALAGYDAATLARNVVDAAVDKKASDVTLLEIGKVTTLADYFVICTGTIDRQINAIARAVEDVMSDGGVHVLHREGAPPDGWVLLDYGQVIVHIFSPEQRSYYDLERRWREAPTLLRIQ